MPAAGTKVQLRLGERVVAEVAFEGAELRIGRMKENDLVINNLAVSRFHAVLRRVGDAFEIEDLGSENGTFVEGVAVRGTALVPAGAAITIGKHTLTVRSGGEAGVRPALAQGAARPPQGQAGKSDVWDAAQTYFVAGPAPRDAVEEEAVAVAIEAERDDDSAAEAVEAVEEAAALVEPPQPPRAEPLPLDLPDDDGALAFDEDELVGEAAPDPVAAEAAGATVEPAELEPLDELSPPEPVASPAPPRTEAGGQTALFDFGLSEDLGLSDRSLARAALGRAAAPPPASEPAAPAPAPAARHAGLIVERLGRVERVVPWGAAEIVAGRAPDCDLVLGASGVSRRHARFVREGDAFRVLDLASANGIRVNGKKVESAALVVGDVVGIDDYTVTFVLDREPVEGVVRAAKPPAVEAKSRTVFEAAPARMPERDLVLESEDESLLVDAEKELELAESLAPARSGADAASTWRFEIAIATERLPAALRRALAELGEDELRLPAELRLVRRV
jgi:pSer/pThr/pTyr-binding forkhead associated (FHA) protein